MRVSNLNIRKQEHWQSHRDMWITIMIRQWAAQFITATQFQQRNEILGKIGSKEARLCKQVLCTCGGGTHCMREAKSTGGFNAFLLKMTICLCCASSETFATVILIGLDQCLMLFSLERGKMSFPLNALPSLVMHDGKFPFSSKKLDQHREEEAVELPRDIVKGSSTQGEVFCGFWQRVWKEEASIGWEMGMGRMESSVGSQATVVAWKCHSNFPTASWSLPSWLEQATLSLVRVIVGCSNFVLGLEVQASLSSMILVSFSVESLLPCNTVFNGVDSGFFEKGNCWWWVVSPRCETHLGEIRKSQNHMTFHHHWENCSYSWLRECEQHWIEMF